MSYLALVSFAVATIMFLDLQKSIQLVEAVMLLQH